MTWRGWVRVKSHSACGGNVRRFWGNVMDGLSGRTGPAAGWKRAGKGIMFGGSNCVAMPAGACYVQGTREMARIMTGRVRKTEGVEAEDDDAGCASTPPGSKQAGQAQIVKGEGERKLEGRTGALLLFIYFYSFFPARRVVGVAQPHVDT